MNTYELIKELAAKRKISVAHVERALDLSNGSISKWGTSKPNSEPLGKVADYFKVSTDYLLGRTDNPSPPSSADEDFPNDLTEEYHVINRSAKAMSHEQQKKLVNLIQVVFDDIDNGRFVDDDGEDI